MEEEKPHTGFRAIDGGHFQISTEHIKREDMHGDEDEGSFPEGNICKCEYHDAAKIEFTAAVKHEDVFGRTRTDSVPPETGPCAKCDGIKPEPLDCVETNSQQIPDMNILSPPEHPDTFGMETRKCGSQQLEETVLQEHVCRLPQQDCGMTSLGNTSAERASSPEKKSSCIKEKADMFITNDGRDVGEKVAQTQRQAKSHKCPICDRVFPNARNLQRHALTHTGEKPHKCETCGEHFTQPSNLRTHELTHTRGKPYECAICGRGFSQSTHLKTHSFTHTGEKPHKCSTCGKQFAQSSVLKAHKLTHTGEKPYQCATCGKQFSQSTHLRSHTRIHTGEKPHKCCICGKDFQRSAHLKSHTRVHTGENLNNKSAHRSTGDKSCK